MDIKCPECGDPKPRRNGKRNNKQRFICNERHSFELPISKVPPKELKLKKTKPPKKQTAEYTETKDTASLEGKFTTTANTTKDILQEFLDEKGIDLNVWEVDKFKISEWDTNSKLRDQDLKWTVKDGQQLMEGHAKRQNEFITKKNFAVSVQFRRITKDIKDYVLEAVKAVPTKIILTAPAPYVYKSKVLLEMSTFDAHIGKLARLAETGYRVYDTHEALKDVEYATDMNINWATTISGSIEAVEYIIGQDMWHMDNISGNTTRGDHSMDYDNPIPLLLKASIQQLVVSILKCREIAPVTIRWVPGNHDYMVSLMIAVALDNYFRKDKHVNCDLYMEKNNQPTRKARLWGDTLVGWTHRIKGREHAWGNELALAFPQEWGKSVFREWHCGDQHQKKSTKLMPEFTAGGVMVRQLTALSPVDKWHFDNLFTDAIPGGEAFLWHKERGVFNNFTAWTGVYEEHRNKLINNK